MKCPEFEQWISDLIDGELPEAKRIILEKHLPGCPSCWAYQKNIEALHGEVIHLDQSSAEPDYFQEFSEKLRTKLVSGRQPGRAAIFVDLGWRWAYAAAAAAFVAVMMVFLVSPHNHFLQDERIVVTSYEDVITDIYGSIGDDAELEELFNTMLLASITKEVEDPNWRKGVDYSDEVNLLEGLTEEEMQLLDTIIKKTQIKKPKDDQHT